MAAASSALPNQLKILIYVLLYVMVMISLRCLTGYKLFAQLTTMTRCTHRLLHILKNEQDEAIKLEGEPVRLFYDNVLDALNRYFGVCEDDDPCKAIEFHAMRKSAEKRFMSNSPSKSLDGLENKGNHRHESVQRCSVKFGCEDRNSAIRRCTDEAQNESYRKVLSEKELVDRILVLLSDTIPLLDGKQKELFEFHYSLLLLASISMSETDPLVAVQSWASTVFPSEDTGAEVSSENPLFWVDRLIYEIIKGNLSNYEDLAVIEEIENEYFYVLTRQYNKLACTSQGLIKLILLILREENVYDGFESVARNIFKLDWRLSLRYFMYTQKADFFFDLVSQRCGLDMHDYNWLYGFRQAKRNTEFLERYIHQLIMCGEYEQVIELGIRHKIDVLTEDLIVYCMVNDRVFGPDEQVNREKCRFLENCYKLSRGDFLDSEVIDCLEFSNNPHILEILFNKIHQHGSISDELLVTCLEKIIVFKEFEELKKYRRLFLKMSLE
eukprot:jgi/Antlo1/942/2458